MKQWLQTTGDTRDLEGYRMCTYTYTSPTAMVLISVGCATPQEPQEQPKPGYQKIAEMLGETKPNRGMLVPSMGILSKAILKSLGDLLP